MSMSDKKKLIEELRNINHISNDILEAFKKIPREKFVPKELQAESYENRPLPIGHQQTISQPYIVAKMTEILVQNKNQKKNKILEIGTGSGYQAAILSQFFNTVYTIERILSLKQSADSCFKQLNLNNIKTFYGDGYQGLPDYAPFDAIIITAAAEKIPPNLLAQLIEGGSLLLPIGEPGFSQILQLITKKGKTYKTKNFDWVTFVPLLKGTD
jgi:protein-L-isoaspartate(D-aspartate) O-methyltransferase